MKKTSTIAYQRENVDITNKIRRDNNINKVKLAYVFETSVRTIERYENGETVPSYEYMINYSKYFDVDINDLVITLI